MREEPIEMFKVKDLEVRIYQDEGYDESPDKWENKELFLVGFHSDFTVKRDGFEEYVAAQAYEDRDRYQDDDLEDGQKEHVKDVKKQYHIFGLEAYIHSGVVLAIAREGNFPDRRWDVSQLGAVFVEKRTWKSRAKAKKDAISLIKEWNSYLSGEVYGYTISRPNTCKTCGHLEYEELDSCWGYVGEMKYCKDEAEASAKSIVKQEAKGKKAKK